MNPMRKFTTVAHPFVVSPLFSSLGMTMCRAPVHVVVRLYIGFGACIHRSSRVFLAAGLHPV
jgi:hypothetical protein